MVGLARRVALAWMMPLLLVFVGGIRGEAKPVEGGGYAALQETVEAGDWQYEISGGVAVLSGYTGTAGEVTLPTTATIGGMNYRITRVANHAFDGNTVLRRVSIPAQISVLGNAAFKGCVNLEAVTFYGDVEDCSQYSRANGGFWDGGYRSGHNYAVFENTGTNSDSFTVTFSEGVTRVPAHLFSTGYAKGEYVYARVTDLVFSDTVTAVGAYAFYNCYDIKEIRLNDNLETVGSYAFANNTSMSSATLGTKANLSDHAFSSCTTLHTVTFGSSADSIGEAAFDGCTALKDVRLNSALQVVGAYAFRGCTDLEEIDIPSSVIRLQNGAFANCMSLRNVTFHGDVEDCSQYSRANGGFWDGGYRSGHNYAVFENAGTNSDSFTVTFAEGVTRVPAHLFSTGYAKGEDVYAHVTDLVFPDAVIAIGEYAFYNCYDIKEIRLDDNLETVGSYAFANNTSMSSATLGTKANLGDHAFSSCTALRTVTFGSSADSIGEAAFDGCTALKDVRLNSVLQVIGAYAFRGCTDLEEIDIPSSVIRLQNGAFANCTSLCSVTFHGDVEDCSQYSRANGGFWDGGYRSGHNYAVFENTGTNSDSFTVTFAEGVTRIPAHLFSTGYARGENVYAHIRSVYFPTSLTSVGEYAFHNCYDLTDVKYAGRAGDWASVSQGENSGLAAITPTFGAALPAPIVQADRLEIYDGNDERLDAIPMGRFSARARLTNGGVSGSVLVLLAAYTESGQYVGLVHSETKYFSAGESAEISVSVHNASGDIATLKVFAVKSLRDFAPIGGACSFSDS